MLQYICFDMQITSRAFQHEGLIPNKYTCDGENINPPLAFSDIPEGTQSLVLIMDDPDVPTQLRPDGVFDHWIIYNIDPSIRSIEENTSPPGTEGINTTGNTNYVGACPPDREHRYFFTLYALDMRLDIAANNATKKVVLQAMEGHILAQAVLMGRYER